MIEATIGTVLLLFAALGAIQLILVFHGALAAHSAAARTARAMALTHEQAEANRVFATQMATSLGALKWTGPSCSTASNGATCSVTVAIPAILPGSGLFLGSSGSLTTISLTETGFYPNFEGAN